MSNPRGVLRENLAKVHGDEFATQQAPSEILTRCNGLISLRLLWALVQKIVVTFRTKVVIDVAVVGF